MIRTNAQILNASVQKINEKLPAFARSDEMLLFNEKNRQRISNLSRSVQNLFQNASLSLENEVVRIENSIEETRILLGLEQDLRDSNLGDIQRQVDMKANVSDLFAVAAAHDVKIAQVANKSAADMEALLSLFHLAQQNSSKVQAENAGLFAQQLEQVQAQSLLRSSALLDSLHALQNVTVESVAEYSLNHREALGEIGNLMLA